jgi:uncharacterized protein (TIGR02145 family)/uncharacterized repeat protein (TIGR02543 family)
MNKSTKTLTLAAALVLALAFTLSCSSNDGGGGGSEIVTSSDSEGGSEVGISSDSEGGSSDDNSGGEQSSSSGGQMTGGQQSYTITYDANGATGVTLPASQTKTRFVDLTLSSTKPTVTGYTFTSWNTSADGSGTVAMPGGIYSVNADVTFYAQWKVETYTVTYDANGGTGAPASQTKIYNVALTLSTTVPTRTGYTFVGWNTSVDGSGTAYTPGASYAANADLTLYAQWNWNNWINNCSLNGGTVKIGNQTWMKENLNCNAPGSKCYGDSEANCAKYGRLYDWTMAKYVCPAGWHLPSDAEWTALTDFVGGSSTAGTKLKATSGWNTGKAGTDVYEFAALPGGGYSGNFSYVGSDGLWWSATEGSAAGAWYRNMSHKEVDVYRSIRDKTNFYSVRCVQD